MVINENWDQQCCTTIVKRKIRKLGYVRGVAKEKIAARELNKKERCKMVKREKRVPLDSYVKRVDSSARMG